LCSEHGAHYKNRVKLNVAVKHINSRGVLLTFPMNNKKEPRSLWTEFFPRKKMVWEWDEDGDASVAQLWHLRTELSESREVVYAKWYQGRATFFSRDFYLGALGTMHANGFFMGTLSRQARDILDILEEDSPLSTKVLKKRADLVGKDNQRFYDRAMRQLWDRFLIVAFGEVEDGAFPSLAVGSTKNLFEDLWRESQALSRSSAEKILESAFEEAPSFKKFWTRKWTELNKQGS
jgi:hypothetical protein